MIPQKTIKGLTFFPVPEFTDVEQAFGAPAEAFFTRGDLPEVPPEFEDMAAAIFYGEGTIPPLHPKVNRKQAFLAASAWLRSFEPSHEAKVATVGYALWLWTDPDALNDS